VAGAPRPDGKLTLLAAIMVARHTELFSQGHTTPMPDSGVDAEWLSLSCHGMDASESVCQTPVLAMPNPAVNRIRADTKVFGNILQRYPRFRFHYSSLI